MILNDYSFTRYLAAKKSVDDRALNRVVWEVLARSLPNASHDKPIKVLEIGAGIGTMLERMLEWDLFKYAEYTALDSHPENVDQARQRISAWNQRKGLQVSGTDGDMLIAGQGLEIKMRLEGDDLFDFIAAQKTQGAWDLLVAHAFLDLVDLPSTMELLFSLCNDGGLFYFTINYDGLTILEPIIDRDLDRQIMALYHSTMDRRTRDDLPSGDSQTGRHLFTHITNLGGQIHAMGSSDWVVFPGPDGYPQDEAFFLHFIIDTIYQALINHPELDTQRFEDWISQRHAQIEGHELVYIAHQLDFVGACPPK